MRVAFVLTPIKGDLSRRTFESIEPQLSNSNIWIIVDDGISQNSLKLLINRSNVRILANEGMGIAAALNTGLSFIFARAKTDDLLIRVDADDVYPENYISRIKCQSQNCSMIYFSNGSGEPFSNPSSLNKYRLILNNPVFHPGVFFSINELFRTRYRYESRYSGVEDYALWLKLAFVDGVCFQRAEGHFFNYEKPRAFRVLSRRLSVILMKIVFFTKYFLYGKNFDEI